MTGDKFPNYDDAAQAWREFAKTGNVAHWHVLQDCFGFAAPVPRQTIRAECTQVGWYDDRGELLPFLRSLVADGFEADELLRVLEKPWNWTAEYEEWKAEQTPERKTTREDDERRDRGQEDVDRG